MVKTQVYCVQAKFTSVVILEVTAISLDDAVLKSKKFKETDFVEVLGDCLDSSFEITGVYTSE